MHSEMKREHSTAKKVLKGNMHDELSWLAIGVRKMIDRYRDMAT